MIHLIHDSDEYEIRFMHIDIKKTKKYKVINYVLITLYINELIERLQEFLSMKNNIDKLIEAPR